MYLDNARTLLNFKVLGQRAREFFYVFCVRDGAATRGQYLASSKA